MTIGKKHAQDTADKWNKMQDEAVIRRLLEHEELSRDIEACPCGNGVIGRDGVCTECGE